MRIWNIDAQTYAFFVLPAPGSSILTGVSSACSTAALSTNLQWASNSGFNAAPPAPDHAASVERGVCTPERALICSCR